MIDKSRLPKWAFIVMSIFLITLNACAAQKKSVMAPFFSEKEAFTKQNISVTNYSGKIVLLNFWASWCPPCRLEIPDLISLQNQYKNDLVIIGASADSDEKAMKDFYKESKMNYPVIFASQKMAKDYGGITGIPTTIVINRKGEIVGRITGFRDKAGFEAAIKPLLKK